MDKLSRRQLGKGIAGTLALGATRSGSTLSAKIPVQRAAAWQLVSPGIWRTTVGSPEAHTPVRSRLIPSVADPLAEDNTVTPPLSPPVAAIDARGVHLTLPLAANELMYGFGLQLMSFQQRGKKRTIRVNADPKGDSGDSHAPVPFYVTTRGYGVFVDTFRQAQFHCGGAHPRPTTSRPPGEVSVNTPAQMRELDRHETSKVRIEVPRTTGVDIYLFAGPSMLEAVRRYNLFSGGGIEPPEWGLGFWYRPEMHLDAKAVLALARSFRERRIPCDVLGLEPGWQTHAYSCTFAWEPSRFPDPAGFVAAMRGLGYRVNLWEHAFTYPSSPIFTQLVPYSGDYAVWEGLVPDFAAEPARNIFGNYHRDALVDIGISGFKLDECDNSDFTEGWSWPDFARFPSGLDGEQMHGAFGLKYQHTILQAFRRRKLPTLGLVRSSGSLAAPYPFVLYSDLYDHRQFIRGLINSGFSGLLWCPEVRDAASEEELLRRLQTVVFSPLAMVNAWYIRNPPWKQIDRDRNNADDFSSGWQTLEARCIEILGWRMSLVPYLRAAFARYAADGTPPFRAPILDFPDDPALRTLDDEYMVGDRILIAPLFAGEPGRTVVLPPGSWHDLWTGERLTGGRSLHVDRSFDRIPAYVRAGSILPWAEPGLSCEDPAARRLHVRVYGDGSLAWQGRGPELEGFTLMWDERRGKGILKDAHPHQRTYTVIAWEPIG